MVHESVADNNGCPPVVSVVIPTYNHAHFLKEALESLCAQTFTDWEAIIVNNFSQDDTVAVVEAFADPRLRLENFQNNGIIAASRNRGIALARGCYVAFLDSDDTWYPEKLHRCLARLDDGLDLVCHGLIYKGNGREKRVFFGPERHSSFNSLLCRGNCIATSATVVRRNVVLLVGGFSENPEFVSAEDYELWLKIADAQAKMGFINEIHGVYRIRPDSSSGDIERNIKAVQQVVNSYLDKNRCKGFLFKICARKRRALIYYAGARGFQGRGEYAKAYHWFIRSLASWPFHFKTCAALLLNIMRYSC